MGSSGASAAPHDLPSERMSGRTERRLLSQRRRVEGGKNAAYDALWAELAARVVAEGSHAWRFVARDAPELHLEFLEFEATRDPRADPETRTLLSRLGAEIAEASVEEWLEDR